MSQLGTGIAAGVAQTALQAQQVGRRRETSSGSDGADAKRLRELLQTHMQALEEGDEFESPAQLHIDGHLPQGGGGSGQSGNKHVKALEAPQPREPSPQAEPVSQRERLYRHLDLQA